jgi:hypothetical protein
MQKQIGSPPTPREDCSLKKTAKQISAEPFFLAKEGNKQS